MNEGEKPKIDGEDSAKPSEKQYAFLFLSRSSFEKKDKDHFKEEIELDYLQPIFKSYVLGRHDILTIFEVEKLSGVGDIISKIYKNYDVNMLNEVVSINCIPYDFKYENRYFCSGSSKEWCNIVPRGSNGKNIFRRLFFDSKNKWKGWISIIFVKLRKNEYIKEKNEKEEIDLGDGINYFKNIATYIDSDENREIFFNSIKAFFVGLDVNDFVIIAQNEDPKTLWKITNTIHDFGEISGSKVTAETSTFFLLKKDGKVRDKQKKSILFSTLIKFRPGRGRFILQNLDCFYKNLLKNNKVEVKEIFPEGEEPRKKYLETYRQGNYDIILNYDSYFKYLNAIHKEFLDFENNGENFSKLIGDICTIVRFPIDTGSFLKGG